MRSLAARQFYQTALGTFFECEGERCGRRRALAACSKNCFARRTLHHHGSQLVAPVMDRWPSFSRLGSRKVAKNHPHKAAFIHLAGDVHASVRASGVEEERFCPARSASSMHVGRSESQLPKRECLPRQESAMGQSS